MPLFTHLLENLYDDLHEEGRISDEDYAEAKRKLRLEYIGEGIFVGAMLTITAVCLWLGLT